MVVRGWRLGAGNLDENQSADCLAQIAAHNRVAFRTSQYSSMRQLPEIRNISTGCEFSCYSLRIQRHALFTSAFYLRRRKCCHNLSLLSRNRDPKNIQSIRPHLRPEKCRMIRQAKTFRSLHRRRRPGRILNLQLEGVVIIFALPSRAWDKLR